MDIDIPELVAALQAHKFDTDLEVCIFQMVDPIEKVYKYNTPIEAGSRKFSTHATALEECIAEIEQDLAALKKDEYAFVKVYIYAPLRALEYANGLRYGKAVSPWKHENLSGDDK